MKKVIGVMPLVDVSKESYWMLPGYMEGISQAGGFPIMLPLTTDTEDIKEMISLCDGFLFTGGHDVDPEMYGAEKDKNCGETSHLRDYMEKEIFSRAVEADKPILGICRGIQLINVLCGGTLYQDLPSQLGVNHVQKPPYDIPLHSVKLVDSPLKELLNCDTINVNSYHHQAIEKLGGGLKCMAFSALDNITEAVYMPDLKFVWGVQWHPEFSFKTDKVQRDIFKEFIRNCQE